jgi:NAD(P)-dependent dehydrogenase (short-subunit alcohol dehydrogenase family)
MGGYPMDYGWIFLSLGRREGVLESAAKTVATGNIIPMVGDVTSKESLKSTADRIEKEVGYINVLIANSGIGGPQAKITPEIRWRVSKSRCGRPISMIMFVNLVLIQVLFGTPLWLS